MGKDKNKDAQRILNVSFTMLLILSAILTVVLYFSTPAMLTIFGASENTLKYTLSYGRIYILGRVFVSLTLGINVFITAQGH